MVKRSKPSKLDYITLKPGDIVTNKIIINEGYNLLNKGEYSIQFIGSSVNNLPNSNTEKINLY